MRGRIIAGSVVLVAVFIALAALSLTHGQSSSAPAPDSAPADPPRLAKDLSKLPPLQRQMHLAAQRGADWLVRCNARAEQILLHHKGSVGLALHQPIGRHAHMHEPVESGAAVPPPEVPYGDMAKILG